MKHNNLESFTDYNSDVNEMFKLKLVCEICPLKTGERHCTAGNTVFLEKKV